MNKLVPLFFSALLFLIIACDPTVEPLSTSTLTLEPTATTTSSPQPSPTATTPPAPSSTPTQTPISSPSATPQPSATPIIPTSTPMIAPTTTPTDDTTPEPNATPTIVPNPPLARGTVIIDGVSFDSEIAATNTERSRGLSSREKLDPQTGMLFVFASERSLGFWMIGMRFPLDFVWIGENCTVVDITHDVPNPETPDSSLPIYNPSVPAQYNLEINAGEAEQLGIHIGDSVRFENVTAPDANC